MSDHPETMRDFFNSRSADYDRHMRENVTAFEEFYRAVARQIPETDHPVEILDLGCGTGLELEGIFARAPRARVTGVDVSPGMLEQLKRKYAGRSDQIQTILGSYLEIDLPAAHYDLALSVMSLHHLLPAPKADLYSTIFQALKSGGVYVEGDYYVGKEQMEAFQAEYQAWQEAAGQAASGAYHLDLPLTLPLQKNLLEEVGFVDLSVHWSHGEAAVLSAGKQERQS